jgi:hypothetical protein
VAGTLSVITAVPSHRCASLYRSFPQGTAQPLQTQLVANDDTWAFSGLQPWGHYFVVIIDDFKVSGGAGPAVGSSISTIAGPLTVPAAAPDAGAALHVQVKPVQLAVLESRPAGVSWQVQWASAHVFDPSSGAEIKNTAQVTVDVGGAQTTMPWVNDPSRGSLYFAQFPAATAAQATYAITTSDPLLGAMPLSWSLVADPPSFGGAIMSPADGATVPANTALAVAWGAQPAADFEYTELFARNDAGAWSLAYTSPQPNDPTTTGETIPGALLLPGKYLLNAAFAKANCPATADGCVLAEAVAVAQFTAQ